jgi:hypothetical protein
MLAAWLVVASGIWGYAQEKVAYFPEILDGWASEPHQDIYFTTDFVIHNPHSMPVTGRLILIDSNGSGMPIKMRWMGHYEGYDVESAALSFTLPRESTIRLSSLAQGKLKQGWAMLESSQEVGATVIFSVHSRQNGLLCDAIVAATPAARLQSVYADTVRRGSIMGQLIEESAPKTGVAIANTTNKPAAVTIRLINFAGDEMMRTTINLEGYSHRTVF